MQLTSFSDYALRLLIYVGGQGGRLVTIEEAAAAYRISRTHLMKVASRLTHAGYLNAVRGRAGGLVLARRPPEIRLGEVLRATEPDFALVECFATGNQCVVTTDCRLRGVLGAALVAFLAVLDRHTLADVMLDPDGFGVGTA